MPRLRTYSAFQFSVLIFFVAAIVRLALFLVIRPYENPIGYEIIRIAETLAKQGAYADPYAALPTGPTAHYPPIYPLFLAAIYFAFGTGKLGLIVHYSVNMLFSVAQYALLPFFATVLGVAARWGFAGGMLGAILPLNFVSEFKSGESLSGLVFLLMTMLMINSGKRGQYGILRGLGYGLLWGLTILLSSSGLPLLVALLLVLAWLSHNRMRALTIYCVAIALGATLPMVPWVMRNNRELGAPVVFRSNLGLELHVAYNDTAAPSIYETVDNGTYGRVHPNVNARVAGEVRDLGEVEFNRRKLLEAEDWIRHHPGRAAKLTFLRAVDFWLPWTPHLSQSIAFWAVTVLALCGLPLLWRASRLAGLTIIAVWVIFPITYWFVLFNARFRLQIHWAYLLPTGALVCYCWERLTWRKTVELQADRFS